MNKITKTINERAEFYEKAIAPLTNSTADIPAHISQSHKALLESVREVIRGINIEALMKRNFEEDEDVMCELENGGIVVKDQVLKEINQALSDLT